MCACKVWKDKRYDTSLLSLAVRVEANPRELLSFAGGNFDIFSGPHQPGMLTRMP